MREAERLRLVSGILLLRWVQLDLDGLFFLVHIEDFPERLVPFGDDLNTDLALGDGRDGGFPHLVGAQFVGRLDFVTELDVRAALNKPHHHTRVIHRLIAIVLYSDGDLGHVGGVRDKGTGDNGGHRQKAKDEASVRHTPIIRAPVTIKDEVLTLGA